MKRKKLRGSAIGPVIILAAGVAIGVAGTLGVQYLLGKHGGGLGKNGDPGIPDISQPPETFLSETVPEAVSDTETDPPAELFTVARSYVEIVVSGDGYLYEGESIELERFLGMAVSSQVQQISVVDDRASLRAYTALLEALEEESIPYAEEQVTGSH